MFHRVGAPLIVGHSAIVLSALAWAHGGSSHLQGPLTAAERSAFDDARPSFERH
jgi:hypothetical protein